MGGHAGVLQGRAALTAAGPQSDRVVIRSVGADERADWEVLWNGYLTFYESSLSAATTDLTWTRLQDRAEPMFLLGAYLDDRLVGIVHYLYHRSCWTAGDYCYLQDLFVEQGLRGGGIGRKLIAAVEAEARDAGASRMYWLTKEENMAARGLYDQVAERSGFIQYRKIF